MVKIWPECVRKKINSNEIDDADDTSAVREEIVNLAKANEFEGMDEADVNELILTQNGDMTNDDLMELDLELAYKEKPVANIIQPLESKILTSKQIGKAMALIGEAICIFTQNDPDEKRSSKVARSLTDDISCYKEIYTELKKKMTQQTLDQYLRRQASTSMHRTCDSSSNTESAITRDFDS